MSTVNLLVKAARNTVFPITAEGVGNIPRNCHEAVLGWLLLSLNYPNPWSLIRLAALHQNIGGLTKQFIGSWIAQKIYSTGTQVDKNSVRNAREGDILFCGDQHFPSHSMVVVYKNAAAVKIRGFNNAGTFSHCIPQPVYMQYDDVDRPVTDDKMWSRSGKFGAAGVDLFLVRHDEARKAAARSFPWDGSPLKEWTEEAWFLAGNAWRPIQPYG